MKKLSIVATALAFAGSAQAADLYVKAPAPAPAYATYDWSGIYVGANAGYGWGDAGWLFNATSPFGQFFALNGSSFTTSPTGALAGGQIGINKQIGSWVWGVEVTGDWSDVKQALVGPMPPATTDVWTTKLKDLETLTARVGYAYTNWLFYGKAGGATGEVNVSAVAGVAPQANTIGTPFSQSQRLWGVTAGGGIEYGLTPNIILGVEYDFTRLFPGQFNGNAVVPGVGPAAVSFGAKSPFDVQVVTGRVSYKF
jgi:outer membrane immunogenic protein